MATQTLPSRVEISDLDPYVVYADAIGNARYHIEVIDGVPQEKPTPRLLHILIQTRLLLLLRQYWGERNVLQQLDVLTGGSNFVAPDLVLVGDEAIYRHGMLASPALLAVEIMSPGQTFAKMLDKCERLHATGTELCWVIWPKKRRAWIYRPEDLLEEKQSLHAPLPDGRTLPVALEELFANLPDFEA